MSEPVSAVIFDLDDTLFLQEVFLDQAWGHVARVAAVNGDIDAGMFEAALMRICREGSDKGRIIDRALASCGYDIPVAPLVQAFRTFEPERLPLLPGARQALHFLSSRLPLGLVTDGDPRLQRAKLRALGLGDEFAVVVLSDELGREHRKPDPAPFLAALARLALDASRVVFVGDRPGKDVVGAQGVGMRTIRVLTGEYRLAENLVKPWRIVASIADVVAELVDLIDVPASSGRELSRCRDREETRP